MATISHAALSPGDTPPGLVPADLRSAYGLAAGGGSGATVAIVDAYDMPYAEEDLAVFRAQFGMAPCTTANGCFRKVDQRGGMSYPAPDFGWGSEIDLDLQMVSAICPNCKLLLVEAYSPMISDLGQAEDTAANLGASVISNSYGGPESSTGFTESHWDHPGVAIVVSSGDDGYGVASPASSPHVIAVGGTSLTRAANARGWTESAWSGTGSGCSAFMSKPSWQVDPGCANRSVVDVSAVADPDTGVAMYDPDFGGWGIWGGTSASAPIVGAIFALANGSNAPGIYPASNLYGHANQLNDVTTGSNGSCGVSYLCSAGQGYDGPTGLGTPNGLVAFTGADLRISGKVTRAGGTPLAGVVVHAAATGFYTGTATTGADGTYSIAVVGGTYTVSFSDPSFHYAAGYYGSGGFTFDPAAAAHIAIGTSSVPGIDVQLPVNPAIRGTVRGAQGEILSGIQVTGTAGSVVIQATTGQDGSYAFFGPAGSYVVSFADPTGAHRPGYYSSAGYTQTLATATPVAVGSADVAGIDVILPVTVLQTHSFLTMASQPGDFVGGGRTYAFSPAIGNFSGGYNGNRAGFGASGQGHVFSVVLAAPSGQPLIPGIYPDAQLADPAPATHPGLEVIGDGGGCNTITGNFTVLTAVYGPGNNVLRFDATFEQHCEGGAPALTGEVSYIAPASLAVSPALATVAPGIGQAFAAEGFDAQGRDIGDVTGASAFAVAGGTCSGATCKSTALGDHAVTATYDGAAGAATLRVATPTTHISGTVRGPGGAPLAGMTVVAPAGGVRFTATSAGDGTYSVAVPSGTYKVLVYDPAGAYAFGYYAGSGYTQSPAAATPVAVGSADVGGVNVALPAAALQTHSFLSLVSQPGDWVGGGQTYLFTPATGTFSATSDGNRASLAIWEPSGYWSLVLAAPAGQPLLPGVYPDAQRAPFADPGHPGLEVVHGGCNTITGTFTVQTALYGSGNALLRLDATFEQHCDGGPALTGEVSYIAPAALAVSPATATVVQGIAQAFTARGFDAQGRDIGDVTAAATFTVAGGTCTHANCKSTALGDHAVTAKYGGATGTATLHVLPLGLGGTVTDGTSGLAGIDVQVESLDGSIFDDALTAADGSWFIDEAPGQYTIGFFDPSDTYASGYLGTSGFTGDWSAARLVTLGTTSVTGLDVVLHRALHISGTVWDAQGSGLSGISVMTANSQSDPSPGGWAMTDVNGHYSMSLLAGSYQVQFWDPTGVHPTGYWSAVGFTDDVASAGSVQVTSADRPGIDVVLPTASIVSGHISDLAGVALEDVQIDVLTGTGNVADSTATDTRGDFSIAVAPGEHRIRVEDMWGTYASGYWSGTGFTADKAQAFSFSGPRSDVNLSLPLALSAPRNVTAIAHDASAAVSWSQPVNDGGSPVTGYVVTSWPGAKICATSARTCTVLGLANGVSYQFTVRAANVGGQGPESDPSNSVTPVGVPGAPTSVHATAGDGAAAVTWAAAPGNGAPITGYAITSTPEGKTCALASPFPATLSCTVTGLTNGQPYTFTVTATNVVGEGSPSAASEPVTPAALPDAPTTVGVAPGDGLVTVSWNAPASDGGGAITAYTVAAAPGGRTCSIATPFAATLSCTVSGLTNGQPYTFRVSATNSSGTGLPSAASTAVVPASGRLTIGFATTSIGTSAGSSLPVALAWSSSLTNTAIARWTLQRRLGTASAWTGMLLSRPTLTSLTTSVAPNVRATFRVMPSTTAGASGPWFTSPSVTARAVQDSATGTIRYAGSGWVASRTSTAYGGSLRYSTRAGRTATATLTGSSFALVSTKGRGMGKAEVWLDSKRVAILDLYSASTKARQVVWAVRFSASGTHKLLLKVLGTRNRGATGTRVDLDGLLVLQ
jgi:hypothetical protein